MCVLLGLVYLKYLYEYMLRFTFPNFPLPRFEVADFRVVVRDESRVMAAVKIVLGNGSIGVTKLFSYACSADKKLCCICFFTFNLCQWFIANSWFSRGILPGTTRVKSNE